MLSITIVSIYRKKKKRKCLYKRNGMIAFGYLQSKDTCLLFDISGYLIYVFCWNIDWRCRHLVWCSIHEDEMNQTRKFFHITKRNEFVVGTLHTLVWFILDGECIRNFQWQFYTPGYCNVSLSLHSQVCLVIAQLLSQSLSHLVDGTKEVLRGWSFWLNKQSTKQSPDSIKHVWQGIFNSTYNRPLNMWTYVPILHQAVQCNIDWGHIYTMWKQKFSLIYATTQYEY